MSHILLVDDDPVQLCTRALLLESQGFEVETAAEVDAALRLLSRDGVAAVVTDHNLAGRSGVELVRALRIERPGLPVLVLSGMPGLEESYAGLDVCLCQKPFPPDQLIRLLRDCLEK